MAEHEAIALLSGGLDSALAAALTARLGFGVTGLNVSTGFCTGQGRCDTVLAAGQRLGIPVRLEDASEEYLDIVRRPKHGYGSAMNPCLDCRVFLLRKAAALMDAEGAEFVVTGEVLGQRPMSQHRRALDLVARESELGERLVRPLSGRLLGPTYPERQGWITRNDWLDIQGRSRKRQLELAARWGIEEFTQPSGGCCILLEKSYAQRLQDAFRHRGPDSLDREAFALLRYGRHFRLSDNVVAVIGRDEQDNAVLSTLSSGRWTMTFPDTPGPTALVDGEPSAKELQLTARLAARYADVPLGTEVTLLAQRDGEERELRVTPLSPEEPLIERLRIDG